MQGCRATGGEGPSPFLPMEKCVFSHFFPWGKMGKKYMEREGNEYFCLSFHILFFHFSPLGKMGEKKYMEREGNEYFSLSCHILFFHGQKWGWTPPSNYRLPMMTFMTHSAIVYQRDINILQENILN